MLDSETPLLSQTTFTVTEPTISSYYQTLNQGDFQATAMLFAPDGQLLPPFESPMVGREAIAAYLEAEAKGMQALPEEETQEILPSGETSIKVLGQVQSPLFNVRVRWDFVLNSESEIVTAKIKLLAALRDLLHLKR